MAWFSQVNGSLKKRHIVLGQYLGFTLLVALSLIGALGALVIPKEWIGLLGFFPIYLGIKALWELKNGDESNEEAEAEAIISKSYSKKNWITNLVHPNIYKVAAITFANGGDNIGIYIPFFSGKGIIQMLITILIFFILVAAWCLVGYKLVTHPLIAKTLERYGHVIIPFVLIILGGYILIESGTFTYFTGV
jgi:cadmium resistance transport/sequestration family protein